MVLQTDEAIDLYRDLCSHPTVSSARICNNRTPGHVKVHSTWSQRDLERETKVQFSRTHVVQLDVVFSTPPTETNNEQWNVESPSGKLKAIVRNVKNKLGEEKQYIEIWNENHKLNTICASNLEQHGKIYEHDSSGQFGCLEWNQEETHLLYVAEKKQPKHKSFFDRKPVSEAPGTLEDVGEQYTFREDWGEQLVGKVQPVLCIIDIEASSTSVLENVPEDISPGQAIWSPNSLGVVFVGWYHEAFKLGLTYCPIRKNDLFFIDLKSFSCNKLTNTDYAVRSPVFSPDYSKLVYLSNDIGGPHYQCSAMKMIDWSTKGLLTVVDVVHKALGPEFPGIYSLKLNRRCWSKDNRRVLLHSFWRSRQELLVVDTDTGEAKCVTQDPDVGSWTLLDVCGDLVLATCASPNQPHFLVISQLPESGRELKEMKWTKLGDKPNMYKDVSWEIIKMEVPKDQIHPDYKELDFETFLMLPVGVTKPPLVVFPHGGPHSVFTTDFSNYTLGLCKCGYAILQINYRGSLGFGADSINSLLKYVGTQDVRDCQTAVEKVFEMGVIDQNRVVALGGSHGGFLTAHLVGQYPDVYKAAVTRNPVINVASMANVTDIPDWCFVEAGIPFEFKNTSNAKFYEEMWNKSPIRYVDNVKAAVLIMIGEEDKRVPPKQGHEFRRALQARGKPVKLLSFPGNAHPITEVNAEADAFMNMVRWFNKYIGAGQ